MFDILSQNKPAREIEIKQNTGDIFFSFFNFIAEFSLIEFLFYSIIEFLFYEKRNIKAFLVCEGHMECISILFFSQFEIISMKNIGNFRMFNNSNVKKSWGIFFTNQIEMKNSKPDKRKKLKNP